MFVDDHDQAAVLVGGPPRTASLPEVDRLNVSGIVPSAAPEPSWPAGRNAVAAASECRSAGPGSLATSQRSASRTGAHQQLHRLPPCASAPCACATLVPFRVVGDAIPHALPGRRATQGLTERDGATWRRSDNTLPRECGNNRVAQPSNAASATVPLGHQWPGPTVSIGVLIG